jgi:hypothetical protein
MVKTFKRFRKNCEKRLLASSCLAVRPSVGEFEENTTLDLTPQTFRTCSLRHPINLLKPTGYVMHHQFNIQQLYALPTPYLCVLYLSENKQRLVLLTS